MKIIGVMLTWNNLDFFKCAFRQAWEFCDELILIEGCHMRRYPKHSTDGTCAYIETIKAYPKLRIADFDYRGIYKSTQRHIRMEYPKTSRYYEPGNWIFHWDDDLFFFDKDLPKIKHVMKHSKENSLEFDSRYFIFNFRFNCVRPSGVYCYRITDGLKLTGVSNACYADGRRYNVRKVDDITAFHYGCVKKPERQKARWIMSVEKGTKSSIERYGKWMGVSWERNEDIFKSEDTIKDLTGGGILNIYEGENPEVLANHPWRHINDVRIIK